MRSAWTEPDPSVAIYRAWLTKEFNTGQEAKLGQR